MIPKNYQWLQEEGAPKMLVEALNLFGVLETPGNQSTQEILSWATDLDLEALYNTDATPWCGLFMAIVAKRSGKIAPKNPLWALNWIHFGVSATMAMLGDVLTFRRNQGGHVAIYVGEDSTTYHVLGGNQSDSVSITRIQKNRLYAIRRPHYNNQPANVRKIVLKATGSISKNEK